MYIKIYHGGLWSKKNYEDLNGDVVGFVSQNQRSHQRAITSNVRTNRRECIHSLDVIFFAIDCVPNKCNKKLIPHA